MSVELVTGYYGVGEDGEPNRHVSSAEDGARQAGTVGLGCYVLSTGSKMSAIMEDANTLLVSDGDALINGRHVRIPDSLSFTIPTGVHGRRVSNLAVLRYSKAADSVESVTPLVLTGEPSTGEPTDPSHNEGSILDGDSPVDMPLYRVVTDGVNAGEPVRLFETVPPIAGLTLGGLAGTLPVSKGGTGATNAASARSNLGLDEAYFGYLRGGRGTISDLSRDTLYNLAPGTYLVSNTATNGPESGNYGNLLVSYSAGNRIVGLLAYDNGHVYTTYGASASGNFNWTRLDNGAYGKLLWSGSWSRGEVTIPGVNQYRVLAASVSNFEHTRLVGVNTGNGTISLFANDCWENDSATSMAASACRLTRTGSSETLTYSFGGRVNLGNNFSYGYGVINSVWGVA